MKRRRPEKVRLLLLRISREIALDVEAVGQEGVVIHESALQGTFEGIDLNR